MFFSRHVARANKWTFLIPPIKLFVTKYVQDGKGWVDPFAGLNSPAEITNDFDSEMPTTYHMLALEFACQVNFPIKGVIFDPPYSYRQISEHYKAIGKRAGQLDTSSRFYNSVMNTLCDKVESGGFALSFGWNTNGFGKSRGFEIVEVMVVAHGQHHNDTLCVAEVKR